MKRSAARLISSNGFRFLFGTGVSLITLYLVFQKVSFADLGQALALVDPKWVLLALVSVGINTLTKVARWKGLMGRPGEGVRWSQALYSFLAGSLLNWIYPARLGDLSRAAIIGNQGPGKIFVLGTITLEKIIDTICYALLIFVLLLIIPLPAWIRNTTQGFALASIAFIFILGLVVLQRGGLERGMDWFARQGPGWVSPELRSRLITYLRSGLSSLDILQTGWRIWVIVFWSIVIWATAFLTTFLIVLSFQLPLASWAQKITASLLTLITLQAGISIPSVPGRLGVFEYACVLALGTFGVEQALASGFGLLLHGIILIPAALVGMVSILILSQGRSPVGRE